MALFLVVSTDFPKLVHVNHGSRRSPMQLTKSRKYIEYNATAIMCDRDCNARIVALILR